MTDTLKKLEQIHQHFISGLYHRAVDGKKVDAASFIKVKTSLNATQSLAIYRGSVLGNLTSALSDIYPAIKCCVGDTFFDALALKYIDQHPSKSASLDNYGEHFAHFIQDFPALVDLPYLVNLAELEWHWHLAFHALDEVVFDASLLSQVPEQNVDGIVFRLYQSMYIIDSPYPLLKLWEMNRKLSEVQELDLSEGGSYILIWRAANYEMRVDKLTQLEYALLSEIKNEQTLGSIFKALLVDHTEEQINQTLSTVVERDWIAGFSA